MTDAAITAVPPTSFSAAGIRERADMQRLLRSHIGIVAPDTMVIAEEFGSWDASARRIDLLGIDRDANLVVIELKRDETGAHMELQALRYASMVARMTFDQTITTYHAYLSQCAARDGQAVGGASTDALLGPTREDARAALLHFLEWDEPDEVSFGQDVRIVLVAADFSRELTTSVMWLNERDLDIRCVQLQPYRLGGQLLIQIEQVIPIREASEYQVQVREKARRERATPTSGMDLTRYDLTIGDATWKRLPKRRLVYHAVRYVIERLGQSPEKIAEVVRHSRPWTILEGEHDAASFRAGMQTLVGISASQRDPRRYMTDDDELLQVGGRTYAFTKMWGTNSVPAMQALCAAYPEAGIRFEASADD